MNLSRFNSRREGKDNEELKHGILSIDMTEGTAFVKLSGKIDATNAESVLMECREILDKPDVKMFIFDMNAVTFVSSAGLRMFSSMNQKAMDMGKDYKLIQMSEVILKLFQMTGYAAAFPIEEKEESI